jgi:hypothetical protein
MDTEQAAQVRDGDTVLFERKQRRVLAISNDGLWAPYFDLDDDGRVSHILVEPMAQAASQSA